jgi:hypothetical protein
MWKWVRGGAELPAAIVEGEEGVSLDRGGGVGRGVTEADRGANDIDIAAVDEDFVIGHVVIEVGMESSGAEVDGPMPGGVVDKAGDFRIAIHGVRFKERFGRKGEIALLVLTARDEVEGKINQVGLTQGGVGDGKGDEQGQAQENDGDKAEEDEARFGGTESGHS